MDAFKTILLVEDDHDLREVVRITLERPSIHILEAPDGASAVQLARQTIPDLILLDWMMPGMEGLEVVEVLRQDPDTAGIPIIMVTARDQASDVRRGLEAGVAAYLVKPFSPLELVQVVEENL